MAYKKPNTFTYIELHRHLFPQSSKAYGKLNAYFKNFKEKAIIQKIQGVSVYTLDPTSHLFYLICHSFKHFLHSGFGIRQVCDLCMFANAYGSKIDWDLIYNWCQDIHGEYFAAALFKIAKKYLIFDEKKAHMSTCWKQIEVDEGPILMDILDAGVFGGRTLSRQHSSLMTLGAAETGQYRKKSFQGWFRTLFPTMKNMKGKYPQLQEKPFLLPWAWLDRILKYVKESKKQDNTMKESVQISKQRIDLMIQYKIIKER